MQFSPEKIKNPKKKAKKQKYSTKKKSTLMVHNLHAVGYGNNA